MNSSNINYSRTDKLAAMTVVSLALSAIPLAPALGYPEFQEYAEKKSGRTVDCAMCHMHEHGPVGDEEGQIGKLSAEELTRLNQARGAMEPGSTVENPILNKFGNELVKAIGMRKVLEAKQAPEKLAQFMADEQDTDGDGIADAREFESGTHPLNPFHGDPWSLLVNNLQKYKREVILACAAILLLDYGFAHLIKGLYAAAKARRLRATGGISPSKIR